MAVQKATMSNLRPGWKNERVTNGESTDDEIGKVT